jgi:glycosyltransferase involved in cell wall biosynthesis
MEIIHLILGKANPERMNGVNKVVYQLATKQHEHNLNVSVWGITKDLTNNYGDRNFKTRLFKKMLNPFSINSELLESILSKKGKAVFHLHGGWIPVFSSVSKFMNSNRISFVYTPHGAYNTIAMKRSFLMKKIYFRLFEKNMVKYAAAIHCIGQSEVAGLKQIFPTDKTKLLPYGFQMTVQEIPRNVVCENMIVGFVGRLDIYTKGIDLLVDAFEDFQKQNPNSKLWIIGDGPEKNKLLKTIEDRGMGQQVIIFGSKFGSEKDNLIKQMHVFAHPSRNEGLPSSVLEASNFGIPSIVSEATNVAAYIEKYNAGMSVRNENKADIKNALTKMYHMWENNALDEMKINAQKMVQDAFDWNNLMSQFNELYAVNSDVYN